MADREKVIKGLERCLVCSTSVVAPPEAQKAYIDCEYTTYLYCRQDKLFRDALELLKEQEEVEPHHKCIGETYSLITGSHVAYCPWCGKKINRT